MKIFNDPSGLKPDYVSKASGYPSGTLHSHGFIIIQRDLVNTKKRMFSTLPIGIAYTEAELTADTQVVAVFKVRPRKSLAK